MKTLRIYINGYCTLTDEIYLMCFIRNPENQVFQYTECKEMSGQDQQAFQLFRKTQLQRLELPPGRISWSGQRCPHCETIGMIKCGKCKQFVCKGNTTDEWFYCRPTCGQKNNILENPMGSFTNYCVNMHQERPELPEKQQLSSHATGRLPLRRII